MKNIIHIFKTDFKRMTQSIVCLVMVIGISIVPCMYGWMNVMATLDPYSKESTSRLNIAVATDDKGSELYGMKLNMGDLLIDELHANDEIGWKFPESSKAAIEGVESGDYYAAIVVPENFSEELITFRQGNYTHPQIIYYENSKSNVIASKVTELAKNTVRDEINSTFTSTLAKMAISSTNVSNGVGVDARDSYDSVIKKLDELIEDMEFILDMTSAMQQLNGAAETLTGTTQGFLPELDSLIDDTSAELISINEKLEKGQADYDDVIDGAITVLNQTITMIDVLEAWTKAEMADSQALISESSAALTNLDKTLGDLNKALDGVFDYVLDNTPNDYELAQARSQAKNFINDSRALLQHQAELVNADKTAGTNAKTTDGYGYQKLDSTTTKAVDVINKYETTPDKVLSEDNTAYGRLNDMQDNLDDARKGLSAARDDLSGTKNLVDRLDSSTRKTLKSVVNDLNGLAGDLIILENNILEDTQNTRDSINDLIEDLTTDDKLDVAIDLAQGNIDDVVATLQKTDGMYNSAMSALSAYSMTLGSLDGDLAETKGVVNKLQSVVQKLLIGLMDFESDGSLQHFIDLSEDDADTISDYLGDPVKLETVEVYPIENYGSASAPFYTLLALWAGALFTMAMFRARVVESDRPENLRMWQEFVGRYALVFMLGQMQALVTGLGIVCYIGIDCEHPGFFILGCQVASLVFTLMNYALAYAMDSIGLGVSVILILMQVAGSGGSFPVEVLPEIYQKISGFLPFSPALTMMREAVGGMYGSTYFTSMGHLLLYGVASIPLCFVLTVLYAPFYKRMSKAKKKTGIMVS